MPASAGACPEGSEDSFGSGSEVAEETGLSDESDDTEVLLPHVVLSLEGLCVSIRRTPGTRDRGVQILEDVTAQVQSGDVLAIIGGSGAGKTTLLDAVSNESKARCERQGRVQLNGRELSRRIFRKSCAYVAQADLLCATATVREALEFAAALYQGTRSCRSNAAAVDGLLQETGLSACQRVLVGDGALIPGISGGQRRRLSVAVELLKRPTVLVLDEPTSGLDSAAAEAIFCILRRIAQEKQIAVMCSIHQPSSHIFQLFDRLLVLSSGRMCYFGAAQEAAAHFTQMGFIHKAGVNPAEFLLRATNTDFCSVQQVQRICDIWDHHKAHTSREIAETNQRWSEQTLREGRRWRPPEPNHRPAPCWRQVQLLYMRALKSHVRSPIAFVGRVALSCSLVSFVMFAYSGARQRAQTQILDRVWALVWLQQLPAFLCVGAVPKFTSEHGCYRKEVTNGLYRPLSYFVADACVNVPLWLVLSFASTLCGFAVIGSAVFNWGNFFHIWLLISCYVGWHDTVAQLCGTLFTSMAMGTMVFMLQIIMNMVFNGTLLTRKDDVSVAIRWLFSVMPSTYSFRSGVYLEFHGLTFDGFKECAEAARDGPVSHAPCFGERGLDVLDVLQATVFPVLTTEDTLTETLAVIIGEMALLKLMHALVLVQISW
ncbi:unnamed protein product [Prorocentrum cordatum]|uniref:ABC transporter domain-containing protein n=1 Tax=Prorocentrum cordatum TaxID=2364126 RepID=A0ABN9QUW2_9DINO|nr:unnamed protein product [Polarella glacialis]